MQPITIALLKPGNNPGLFLYLEVMELCGVTRGTTPLIAFRLPIEISELAEVWVTVSQKGKVVINKTLDECWHSDNLLSVYLTQEETLLLDGRVNAYVQLRALTPGGNALASKKFIIGTSDILKDGVIQ